MKNSKGELSRLRFSTNRDIILLWLLMPRRVCGKYFGVIDNFHWRLITQMGFTNVSVQWHNFTFTCEHLSDFNLKFWNFTWKWGRKTRRIFVRFIKFDWKISPRNDAWTSNIIAAQTQNTFHPRHVQMNRCMYFEKSIKKWKQFYQAKKEKHTFQRYL